VVEGRNGTDTNFQAESVDGDAHARAERAGGESERAKSLGREKGASSTGGRMKEWILRTSHICA